MTMIDFINNHLGNVIEIAIILVTIGIAWGIIKSKLKNIEENVEELQNQKADETRWIVNQHTTQLSKLEAEQSEMRKCIFDMKTKVEMIYEWVRDQKEQRN